MKKSKNIIKCLLFKSNGSVSIYAIIIILPVFLLNALFIDSMRILVAERKAESSMDAALRSTMAKFDSELASLGLFAYSGEEGSANSDFQSYLKKSSLTNADLSGYFNIGEPTILADESSVSVDINRNLAELDVFRAQVIESMKYQAPVQIGVDIFEMFAFNEMSSDDVDDMQELVDDYQEILKIMKKRNNKIDKAKKKINLFKDKVNGLKSTIVGSKIDNDDIQEKIPKGLKTFHELKAYHDRYASLIKKEDPKKSEKKEIENYENVIEAKSLFGLLELKAHYDAIPTHLIGDNGSLASPEAKTAKAYNDEIKEMIGSGGEEYDELNNLVMEDSFFELLLDNSEAVYNELILEENSLDNPEDLSKLSLLELVSYFYITSLLPNGTDTMGVIIQAIDDKFTHFSNDYFKKKKNEFDKYEKIKKELDNTDVEDEEDKADSKLSDIFEMINELKDLKGDQDEYEDLKNYVSKYEGAFTNPDEEDDSGVFAFIKQAFDRFSNFIDFVGKFPGSIRNELYINEYVLANFGTEAPYSITEGGDFYKYKTKKGQYITYGHHVAGINYFNYLLDMTFMFLVVNLLDQLKKGGFAGPLGFYKAIATSLAVTFTELTNFVSKGEIEWNPFKMFTSKSFSFNGTMFLRMFMGIRTMDPTYNDNKIRRIQAAVSHETGRDLLDSPSYIKGQVKGKIKLWFIPKLAEVLPGNVEGNYYEFEKEKVYSY